MQEFSEAIVFSQLIERLKSTQFLVAKICAFKYDSKDEHTRARRFFFNTEITYTYNGSNISRKGFSGSGT